jgi:hypothetical protein
LILFRAGQSVTGACRPDFPMMFLISIGIWKWMFHETNPSCCSRGILCMCIAASGEALFVSPFKFWPEKSRRFARSLHSGNADVVNDRIQKRFFGAQQEMNDASS